MSVGVSNYEVFPCVILCEKKQRITIKPCGDAAKFEDGTEYTVSILPTEHSEVTYILDCKENTVDFQVGIYPSLNLRIGTQEQVKTFG